MASKDRLEIPISLEVSDFESGLDTVRSKSEETADNIQRIFNSGEASRRELNTLERQVEEYENLSKSAKEYGDELERLIKRQDEMKLDTINQLKEDQPGLDESTYNVGAQTILSQDEGYQKIIQDIQAVSGLLDETEGKQGLLLQTIQETTSATGELPSGGMSSFLAQLTEASGSFGKICVVASLFFNTVVQGSIKATTALAKIGKQGMQHTISGFKSALSHSKSFFSHHSRSTPSFLKDAKRMAFAVLGVRSSFTAVRKIMSAYLEDHKSTSEQINSIWSTLATALEPVITGILNMVFTAISYIAALIKTFTGIDLIATQNANAIKKQTEATKGATSAQKENNKAKKEALKYAGFDEKEVLSNNSNDSSSGGGSGGSGGGGSGSNLPKFEAVDIDTSWIDGLKKAFDEGWYELGAYLGESLNNVLKQIPWDDIRETANEVGKNLASFLNGAIHNIDWELIGKTIAQGINTALEFLNGFVKTFDFTSLGFALATAINGITDNIDWKLFSDTLGRGLQGAIEASYSFLKNLNTQKLSENVGTSLNNALKKVDFNMAGSALAEGLNRWVDTVNGFVSKVEWYKIGTYINDALNGVIKDFDWSKWTQTLSRELATIPSTIGGFLANLDWSSIGNAVINAIKGIDWSTLAKGIGEGISGALKSALNLAFIIGNAIEDGLASVGDYFSKEIDDVGGNIVLGILNGIGNGLKNIGKWISDNIFKPFIDGIKKAFDIHSPSKKMIEIGVFVIQGLLDGIVSLIVGIGKWIQTNVFDPIWNALTSVFDIDNFLEIGSNIIDGIFKGVDGVKTWALDQWEKVAGWFGDIKKNISAKFTDTKEKIKEKWEEITSNVKSKTAEIIAKIATKWGELKKAWSDIVDNIKDKTANMKAKIANKWSDLKGKWNDLLKNFKGKTVEIGLKFSAAAKDLKSWINKNVIGKIEGSLRKIPVLGNKVKLPRLARGGIVNRPTQAIIGEAGTEAVMPLQNNLGWLDTLADMLSDRMNIDGNSTSGDINLYIDGEKLFKWVKARERKERILANG